MAEAGGAFEYISGLRECDSEEEDFSLHAEVSFNHSTPHFTSLHFLFVLMVYLHVYLGKRIREVLQGRRQGVETLLQSPGTLVQI